MAKKLSDEIATRKRSINFYSLGSYLPDPDIVLRKQGKDVKIYRELGTILRFYNTNFFDSHIFPS
ncbi:MAG: hypothetical protein IJ681_02380 [Bacteroidales bacterium]|nr:hypothetical protein [Bacteroidales bacterium]